MATIKVPKTPRNAYNPQRPASELLRAHVRNLEKALNRRPVRMNLNNPISEQTAAAYIRQLTRELHHVYLLPEVEAAPTIDQQPTTPGPRAATRSNIRRVRALRRRRGGRR